MEHRAGHAKPEQECEGAEPALRAREPHACGQLAAQEHAGATEPCARGTAPGQWRAATRRCRPRRELIAQRLSVTVLVSVLLVLPRAGAQFCPFLSNPEYVYGVEDAELNMQAAWITAAGDATAGPSPAVAGRLWHGKCPSTVCGSCLGSEEAEPGQQYAFQQQIRITYSVQYGRLFLAEGYLNCNLVVDDAAFNFDTDVADVTRKSFSVVGTYDVVNCTMAYLRFQGLRFANKMTQLANYGKQPQVTVLVAPPRTSGPSETGLQFIYEKETTTFIVMEEVNSLPNLETCPTMRIEKDNDLTLRYWEPGMGGDRCLDTPLPGGASVLFRGLKTVIPDGWQAKGGTAVAPMKIFPAFCQIDEVREEKPPYCLTLSQQGHTSCSPDPNSYFYHMEDDEDSTLRVNGIRMWDKDLWNGHVDTTFAFRFLPVEQDGVSFKLNDPFDHDSREPLNIEAGSGLFSSFCARPYYDRLSRAAQYDTEQLKSDGRNWNKHCARSWTEAISDILPMDKSETKLYVSARADRTPLTAFDKTNCDMVECLPESGCDPFAEAQQDDNKWRCSHLQAGATSVRCMVTPDVRDAVCFKSDDRCICNSLVSARSSEKGQNVWTTYLFWQLADRNNQSKVYETGYLRMKYNNQSIIDGTLWADPQTLPYQSIPDGVGLPFDWFRASPMRLSGKIATADSHTFTVDASTKPIVNPLFEATVQALYGNVSLPNIPANLPSLEQTRSRIKIRGTISDLNAALSVVEYRVPGFPFPNFHTLSNRHSVYGNVEEEIALTIDDGGNAGAPSGFGEATRMNFNLVVSATSKPF